MVPESEPSPLKVSVAESSTRTYGPAGRVREPTVTVVARVLTSRATLAPVTPRPPSVVPKVGVSVIVPLTPSGAMTRVPPPATSTTPPKEAVRFVSATVTTEPPATAVRDRVTSATISWPAIVRWRSSPAIRTNPVVGSVCVTRRAE